MKAIISTLAAILAVQSFAQDDLTGKAINGKIRSTLGTISYVCQDQTCSTARFVKVDSTGNTFDISRVIRTSRIAEVVEDRFNQYRPRAFPLTGGLADAIDSGEGAAFFIYITVGTPFVASGAVDLVSLPLRRTVFSNRDFKVIKKIKKSLGTNVRVSQDRFTQIEAYIRSI